MSIKGDLKAAGKELQEEKQRMSIAGGVISASFSVASVMNCNEADVWRVVAVKRLIKVTRAYTAGLLFAADQLNAELKVINDKKGTKDDKKQ